MFNEENLFSPAAIFCPSTYVHPNPASHDPANYKKESFREIFVFFLQNFRFFIAKFSHYCFSKIFVLFCAKFSQYLVHLFSRNFRISYFTKIRIFSRNRFKRNFTNKAKILAFSLSKRNAKK